MDFSRLAKLGSKFNSTGLTPPSLPSTVLDLLIPGYGTVSQLTYNVAGIDIGIIVSGWFVIFSLFTAWRYVQTRVHLYYRAWYSSTVTIEDYDVLFYQINAWVAAAPISERSRKLMAVTPVRRPEATHTIHTDTEGLNEYGIFNYEEWANNIPLTYEPRVGAHEFHFNGHLFIFNRRKNEAAGADSNRELIQITCIGRNTRPIKELLNTIRRWSFSRESTMTFVYRATDDSSESRDWVRLSTRTSRPICTISLDLDQKSKIVTDINDYLKPATARWYAARGIPHRRGYLFHGPPGTGKTSLSFALGGIFGLKIYCVSLNGGTMTESQLASLFTKLPRRCIVLLEDIDSAGIRRDDVPTPVDSLENEEVSKEASGEVVEKVTAKPSDQTPEKLSYPKSPEKNTGKSSSGSITLSGLLNVIDGAASHEGHVLIMTTNTPEVLDDALIRPGRVDLQVYFTLATNQQIRDIFMRMYSTTNDTKTKDSSASGTEVAAKASEASEAGQLDQELLSLVTQTPKGQVIEPARLEELAEQFAAALPEKKLSPAEVQGYLLMHKQDPQKAVEEVAKFRDELLKAKKEGKKVIGSQ